MLLVAYSIDKISLIKAMYKCYIFAGENPFLHHKKESLQMSVGEGRREGRGLWDTSSKGERGRKGEH